MSTRYFLTFASGDPRPLAGLSPTFLIYKDQTGVDVLPTPVISSVGASTGIYFFQATPSATFSIAFLVDGGSAVSDSSARYLKGSIDPIANVDQQLGFSNSSYGTTLLPSTVSGLAQRIVQLFEADANFNKTTGVWSNVARGTSTVLMTKTLTNNVTETTKI